MVRARLMVIVIGGRPEPALDELAYMVQRFSVEKVACLSVQKKANAIEN
jgi:hypothetical protein